MPEKGVKLVLTKKLRVAGVVREPGHTLLEAIAPEATTRQELEKAIEEKAIKVYTFQDADGRPQVARSSTAALERERARQKAALEAAVKKDEAEKRKVDAWTPKKPAKKKGFLGRKR